MPTFRFVLPLLVLAVMAAGCASVGYDTRYPDRRYPDRRYPDTRRTEHHASHYYHRVDRDVHDYVRRLDRPLRLNRRQQRQIGRLLTERTYRLLDRTRSVHHDRVYPFPRRTGRYQRGTAERWWRTVDRQVDRYLNRHQRDAYRAFTHRYDDRYRPNDRRYGKNRGSYQGRGRKRGHYQ